MKQPKSLQELAELVMRRQDASARQVAQRAEKRGLKLAYTTLNQMRSGTYRSVPRHETLKALAEMAGIDEDVAFHAAGITAPGPPLAAELPPGSDNLTPRSRATVIELIRRLVDLEAQVDQLSTPNRAGATGTPASGSSSGTPTGPDAADVPPPELLAAHPDFVPERERQDKYFDALGEDSQDSEEHDG